MSRAPRSRLPRHRHVVPIVLLVVWSAVVLLATLWPTTVDGGLRDGFLAIADLLERRFDLVLPFRYTAVEVAANVALFVPLGFAAAWAMPKWAWWIAALAGAAMSVAVELAQQNLLPERFGSFGDVVANSVGALIGAVLVRLGRAWVHGRRRRRRRRAQAAAAADAASPHQPPAG